MPCFSFVIYPYRHFFSFPFLSETQIQCSQDQIGWAESCLLSVRVWVALRLVLFTVFQTWFAMVHVLHSARLHSWFPSGEDALPFHWVISYLVSKGRFPRWLCHRYASALEDEKQLGYLFIHVLNAQLLTMESRENLQGRAWLIWPFILSHWEIMSSLLVIKSLSEMILFSSLGGSGVLYS